ncbi:MAG: HD-GYP domain-containing protein [Bdellovibrionales bacterium]
MESSEYTSVRVNTLRGDLKIPFDVYVHVAGKYIHYCRQGDSFEGTRLERLKSKKLKKMFIRIEQESLYRKYLEDSIDSAYEDTGKPLETRAEVIQGFQQAAAEQYMEDPKDEISYTHARSSVHRLVQFLNKEPFGALALLKLKNTDQSITHHSVNVAALSAAMALESNLREKNEIALLSLGCLLHDIDHFFSEFDLSRPIASLGSEELTVYKSHPMKGAERLQSAPFMDQLVLSVVLQHEEHADGTGFPKGMRGEDMDPMVMVAATANAYDRAVSFEQQEPKDALKHILIDKLGAYPLPYLQSLQRVLKAQKIV